VAQNPRIDELRQRLEREPGSRLFAQLAEELRKEGEVEEAIRISREGLGKHPGYPSAHMTLGRALMDTGDLAGARAEFETTLKGAPDNILASRFLGECLEGLGDLKGALERFRLTLALAPGDRVLVGRLQALEGRLERGETPHAPEEPRPLPPIALVPTDESFELEGAAYQAAATIAPKAEPASTPKDERPAAPPPPAAAPLAPAEEAGFAFEAPPREAEAPGPVSLPPVAGPAPQETAPEEMDFGGATVPPSPVGPPPSSASEPPLSSATLAELYFNQGFTEKAIEVYRELLAREPGNVRAEARVTELEALDRHLREEEQRVAAPAPRDPRAARREAIERTIARLEQFRAAFRRT
jgi:tetratricopeptide (TPR) repeat protein